MVDRTRQPGQKRRPKSDGQGCNRCVVNPALDRLGELIELRKERAELQPLAGPRPFAPRGGTPPPFASAPSRLQERPPRLSGAILE
jgi:hypothetical protein